MINSRSQKRTFVLIILILLLLNLLVVGYFLFSHRKPQVYKGHDRFVMNLRKEVGFNETQIAEFKKLQTTNWAEARTKTDQIRHIKNEMLDLLKLSAVADSTVENMADSIGTLQKQLEIYSYRHFKATRALCTPEQKPRYDSMMKRIINRSGRGSRPPEEKK